MVTTFLGNFELALIEKVKCNFSKKHFNLSPVQNNYSVIKIHSLNTTVSNIHFFLNKIKKNYMTDWQKKTANSFHQNLCWVQWKFNKKPHIQRRMLNTGSGVSYSCVSCSQMQGAVCHTHVCRVIYFFSYLTHLRVSCDTFMCANAFKSFNTQL